MKDNYTGYPSTEGSGRYDMSYEEDMYRHRFYNDREFHVERIKRGKEIRNGTLGKAALEVVAIGAFALGVVLHGKGLASDIFNQSLSGYSLAVDIIAVMWSLGLGGVAAKALGLTVTDLKHISTDLNVSKKMMHTIDESSSVRTTDIDDTDSKNNEQDSQGGIKK